MGNHNRERFDLMRLAPELQVKVFEALPTPWAVVGLRLTCRDLNALFLAYRTQIETATRDNLVAPFYDYYRFLGRLHIPESDIKHPPAEGWPNITVENCSGFREFERNISNTDFKSNVIDYSKTTRKDFGGGSIKSGEITHEAEGPVSRHKVVIAEGYESGGIDLILDTRTGEIFEEIIRIGPGENLPVREYFELKMKQCRELKTVFAPGEDAHWGGFGNEEGPYDAAAMEEAGEPSCPDDYFALEGQIQDLKWVCHLYRKYGWPGEGWRKEEGLKAIAEYVARRTAEERVRHEEVDRRKREEERRNAEANL
ncbi:hypothetical protein INS49_003070 [Diaporthe citri]|uniref:uncharacterized protein n=1 Tax=Diaporthe citri TaxID=83186 RepID=UPI001C81690E|nr:uncharacterized protein INS49_003070 [Diaporthe citri]KAG6368854.1 hypothetical protein INS49_003070 [Diaporthe citri]